MWKRLERARTSLQGSVCYCSALDECWVLSLPRNDTEHVTDCD